jgi:transcriptional regulator with GAF, ATPase, and Fis domain
VIDGLVPWYNERLRKGETLRFDRIPDDVPAEGHREREYALAHGMRSHVCIPLAVNGWWMCALGSATFTRFFTWSESIVLQMLAVGQILANALHRERIETELQKSIRELHRLKDRLTAENEYLREESDRDAGFAEIVGRTPALRAVLDQAARVAPMPTAVLLLGETGTGKELLARAIHARSPRRERALILSDGSTLARDGNSGSTVPERAAVESLEAVEREHIAHVLDRCGWRINGEGNAAELLRLHPNTLRSRLKRLGIRRPASQTRSAI